MTTPYIVVLHQIGLIHPSVGLAIIADIIIILLYHLFIARLAIMIYARSALYNFHCIKFICMIILKMNF